MNEERGLIEVLFKSGATVLLHCRDFKVNISCDGKLTGYEYKDVPADEQALYINVSDVDCIRVVPEK